MRAGSGLAAVWVVVVVAAGAGHAQEVPPTPPPPPPGAAALPPPPPPPPQPPVVAFHVVLDGQAAGPFDLARLAEMVAAGRLKRDTYVWRAGTPEWVRADTVAELAPLLAALPPDMPFDCNILVGTWERTETIGGFTLVTTITYAAGGSLSGFQRSGSLAPVEFFGTWKAVPAGARTCTLTLDTTWTNGTPAGSATANLVFAEDGSIRQDGSGAIIRRLR